MRSTKIIATAALLASWSSAAVAEEPEFTLPTVNLTVTFSSGSPDECAKVLDEDTSGITFSTNTIPETFACFNLYDIFTANSSRGILRQTSTQPYQNIVYQLYDMENYNAQANYSNVWFQSPGPDQSRALTVYNGRDCVQVGDPLQPWYGYSCQTPDTGSCDTVGYSVQSFGVNAAENVLRDGDCWAAAYQGAAARTMSETSGASVIALIGGLTMAILLF